MSQSTQKGRGLCALLASVLAFTCCGEAPWFSPTGRSDQPIHGGVLAPGEGAVVGLALSSDGYVCTGTLIEPDIVLTASHCVAQYESTFANARAIFGSTLGATTSVLIREVHPNPGYNATTKANDVAVVHLVDQAPAGTPLIPIPPAGFALSGAHEDRPIRFVGYGRTATEPTGTKREITLNLDLVCSSGPCSFAGAAVPGGSLAYGQAEGGPCLGDSGGPVLFTIGGKERVIGVNASGDPDCTVFGQSSIVDRHQAFIQSYIDAIPIALRCGGDPCPEPPPEPDGGPTDPDPDGVDLGADGADPGDSDRGDAGGADVDQGDSGDATLGEEPMDIADSCSSAPFGSLLAQLLVMAACGRLRERRTPARQVR